MEKSGKFIVLEGLDGSGSSTQCELLKNYLAVRGIKAIVTKEPTTASKKIHAVLRHRTVAPSPLEFQKMYIADRLAHIKNIIVPALAKGKTVICQRYALSTFAYGTAFGVSQKDLRHDFLRPDISFLLDLPANIAMKRIESRKKTTEYFEKTQKLAKIRGQYLKLAKKFKAIIIDARPIPELIVKKILWHMR